MAFADINDARLFFTDEGAGSQTLLLVHGFTCDSHDWSWQLPRLVECFRVIAVDLRGHGRSSAPPSGYSAKDLAADLAALLGQIGAGPVIAVGHSLGGVVVSALAVERPDLVTAVVCVDPAYLIEDRASASTEAVVAGLRGPESSSVVQRLIASFDTPARSPALRVWQMRRAAGVPMHVLSQTIECQMTGLALASNSRPYLARRLCPVLSFYIDPRRADREAESFRDARSRCVTWEGAGHWLHQERPAEFNALVIQWVEELTAPSFSALE